MRFVHFKALRMICLLLEWNRNGFLTLHRLAHPAATSWQSNWRSQFEQQSRFGIHINHFASDQSFARIQFEFHSAALRRCSLFAPEPEHHLERRFVRRTEELRFRIRRDLCGDRLARTHPLELIRCIRFVPHTQLIYFVQLIRSFEDDWI